MGISKFNHEGRKFTFNTPTNHPFKNLQTLYNEYGGDVNKVTLVRAVYINHKSKFGDAPCLVTDFETVNLPKFMTEDIEQIITDDEIVRDINNEKVGFKITPYEKDGNTYYGITWVEI